MHSSPSLLAMIRFLALGLLVGLACPLALAQSAGLVGTWEVQTLTDPAAEPAPDGTLAALLPDNPYTFAPIKLRFDASGEAVVTLLVARGDGYDVLGVPSTYRIDAGRLALSLGEDLNTDLEMDRQGDLLTLRGGDGSVLALRRTL